MFATTILYGANPADTFTQRTISITLQTLPVAPGSDSVSCIIPFSRAGNLILLRAKADTTDGNFILDTGAPGLVLNITYFRDYPTTVAENEEQNGITGSVSAVTKTQVNDLVLGCIHNNSVPADLLNLGHIENTKAVRILGLIGLSVFSRFEMIIDYENSLLYLHRIGKKEATTYKHAMLKDTAAYSTVPIEIWNHKIMTSTIIAGKKLRLIIDSGAECNLLDSRLPSKIFDNVEILKRINLSGAGNKKVEALYGNLNNLTIGDQNTGSLPVIITNLEKTCLADNTCIDGILGFDFLSLHKIGFNFVNNKMYIWK
ncbi:MAG: aspartyl protease family protein [Chitinophagaceae bacterium]|nr:aspartyl protease family protein [Chitinophagaceae bacterium]